MSDGDPNIPSHVRRRIAERKAQSDPNVGGAIYSKGSEDKQKVKRDTYDWLMFAVGVAGVIAVVATIIIGRIDQNSNSKDVRNAIGKMAAIATATHDEKPFLKKQADALSDTAKAAQVTADASSHQSADFKRQTDAIVKQADALIRNAQATVTAAGAQLAAAQASIKTAEAGQRAADQQLRSAELIAAGQQPSARLESVVIEGYDGAPDKDGMINVRVKPTYVNNGSATLNPILVTFNLIIASSVPSIPPAKDQNSFGRNEVNIPPNSSFYPVNPYIYKLSSRDIEDEKSEKKAIFVWGVITFSDIHGGRYRVCYGATVAPPMESNPQGGIERSGPESYHCGGG